MHIYGSSQPGRTSGGKICPSNEILKHDFWPILNDFQTFIKVLHIQKIPQYGKGVTKMTGTNSEGP